MNQGDPTMATTTKPRTKRGSVPLPAELATIGAK